MKEKVAEKEDTQNNLKENDSKSLASSKDPVQKSNDDVELTSKARRNKKKPKSSVTQKQKADKDGSPTKIENSEIKENLPEKKNSDKANKSKKSKKGSADTGKPKSSKGECNPSVQVNGDSTAATSLPVAEKSENPVKEENPTAVNKKKLRNKRKKKTAKKDSGSKEEKHETENYSVDYQSLRDALAESFDLEGEKDTIYFAPINTSKIKHQDRASPSFSFSTPTVIESKRTSNKSKPTPKNKHAEIPPPPSLTATKKIISSAKTELSEKSSITKIKGAKNKSVKNKAPIAEKNEVEISKKTAKNEGAVKHDEKTSKANLLPDKASLGQPVKPVVFVKEEKKHKTVVLVKKSNETTKGERKRGQKELKDGLKNTDQQDYCHPNDIIHNSKNRRMRYEPYLDPKVYEERLKKGELYKGVIRINKRNRSEAYVTCDDLESDIFIYGQIARNRAFEGDTVIVELVDLDTIWNKKKEAMKEKQQSPPEGDEDKNKPKFAGKVVAIPTPNPITTCSGLLAISRNGFNQSVQQGNESALNDTEVNEMDYSATADTNNKDVRLVWFKPTDLRKPIVAVQLKNAPSDILVNEDKYRNLLMVVNITRWPIDSLNPFGKVVRELGHIGNIPAETQAVLEDNGIIEKPFSKKALKNLPETPWSISQSEIDKRRDLRETRIFTIDPATAKDLDDAVHVIKLGENQFEVGVHIADVSHFVQQHTALDHEAFDRGTSTYLCDRVIPMLPSLLCEQLCSLNPDVERLAFSVIWKMDGEGNIKDTWFGKSIIKSCAKLAYEDAQSVIENKGLPKTATVSSYSVSEVEQDINYLYEISKCMRKRRFDSGALSINSIRLSFQLNDLGEPCGVSVYEQKDSNRLIEEFMLCANMSVAQKICSHFPNEALLRHHSPPHDKTLNEFIRIAENLGYTFDGSSAGSLQRSFEAIESEDAKAVLRLLAVKPMQRAKYFCTGSYDSIKYRHYALNVPLYTHFTSPIRRFPDIIVHRQLEAALDNKKSCGYKKEAIEKAAGHCNQRKEGAKNSQDSNIQLYLAHYLHMLETQSQKPVICSAIVTQVLKDCFEILVPEYGIEKRIHMDALPIDKFTYDGLNAQLSVYWKEGIEANRSYDEKRKINDDYIQLSSTQTSADEDNDEPLATLKTTKIPEKLSTDSIIDKEKKSQRFTTFCKLDVRIQVNVERSPPIVFVYPVNPFM